MSSDGDKLPKAILACAEAIRLEVEAELDAAVGDLLLQDVVDLRA